jgi:hypothetical protein
LCAYCSKKAKTNPAQNKDRQGYRSGSKGSLKVVGIGPGDIRHISQRAREAIEECQVIVGYNTYIKLLGDSPPHQLGKNNMDNPNWCGGKEIISSVIIPI